MIVVFSKVFVIVKAAVRKVLPSASRLIRDIGYHRPNAVVGIVGSINNVKVVTWIRWTNHEVTRTVAFTKITNQHILSTRTAAVRMVMRNNGKNGNAVHGIWKWCRRVCCWLAVIVMNNMINSRSNVNVSHHLVMVGCILGNIWTPNNKGDTNIMFVQVSFVPTKSMLSRLKAIVGCVHDNGIIQDFLLGESAYELINMSIHTLQ